MEILVLLLALVALSQVVSGISLAPWVPTPKRDLERVDRICGLNRGDTFYELGFGDGRVSRFIATRHPDVTVIGFELNPFLYAIGAVRQRLWPIPNLTLRRADIFTEKLSAADVLYVFGMPESLNRRLGKKLQQEAEKPLRLISYSFRYLEQEPSLRDGEERKAHTLYAYDFGVRRA